MNEWKRQGTVQTPHGLYYTPTRRFISSRITFWWRYMILRTNKNRPIQVSLLRSINLISRLQTKKSNFPNVRVNSWFTSVFTSQTPTRVTQWHRFCKWARKKQVAASTWIWIWHKTNVIFHQFNLVTLIMIRT